MNYKIIEVGKFRHVLCTIKSRENSLHEDANYRGTGMALCGVLAPRASLVEFVEKHSARNAQQAEEVRLLNYRKNARKDGKVIKSPIVTSK
jgi:hypothetical protein